MVEHIARYKSGLSFSLSVQRNEKKHTEREREREPLQRRKKKIGSFKVLHNELDPHFELCF